MNDLFFAHVHCATVDNTWSNWCIITCCSTDVTDRLTAAGIWINNECILWSGGISASDAFGVRTEISEHRVVITGYTLLNRSKTCWVDRASSSVLTPPDNDCILMDTNCSEYDGPNELLNLISFVYSYHW